MSAGCFQISIINCGNSNWRQTLSQHVLQVRPVPIEGKSTKGLVGSHPPKSQVTIRSCRIMRVYNLTTNDPNKFGSVVT